MVRYIEKLILLENTHYLIINKPGGIPSLDDRDKTLRSIKDLAQAHNPELRLCHRLDKETSGVLVLAKSADAYRNLAIQFEKRAVYKIYHTIVDGIHHFNNLEISLPISVSGRGNVRIDKLAGKPASTVVNTLQGYKAHTLFACRPKTGRLHQIRVHLATHKAHIVADLRYGGKHTFLSSLKKRFNLKKETQEQPLINRVALHSFSIAFLGMDKEKIAAQAPYSKDISAFITQLEKNL